MGDLIIGLIAVILAPIAGGLIAGADRIITARLQSRYGPPLLQPFYDVLKLLGKAPMIVNSWQVLCAYVYLISSVLSVFLFFFQGDLLLIFFVLTIGGVFLVFGALSTPSPYSQIGGQRELLQMLAYEPLIILVFVAISLVTGDFKISSIYAQKQPLLMQLPLMFVVLGYALTIKLRKSPFDLSASHHAHQELVRGVLTEYSGPFLAVIEIAHFYDVILILGLCSLFWHTALIPMIILLAVTYFLEILVDNTMARMTWRWMLEKSWAIGLALSIVNITFLYAR